ncbi:MAG: NAD(P)/FAD-dependent oxidoreductase [Candidatus Thorarchaeota archaeon]
MKLVVIGYGPGGVSAATSARIFNRDAEVIIYTSEQLDAHQKPGASLALEHPDTNALLIPDWSMKQLREMGIEINSGVRVVGIDTSSKTLRIDNEGSLTETNYDKLILATGGIPSVPEMKGADLDGVFTIQDMSDTSKIGQRLDGLRTLFVIGAGFSGLEVAERLIDLGKDVHLVVRSRLMRRLLEESMSAELLSRLPTTLNVHMGVSPEEILGTERVKGIKLNDTTHNADAILFMTGVKPNIGLATSMGLHIGDLGGIKVNNLLETSMQDVYSVGDCIEMFDRITGKPILMPIGSVAARAGRQAGVAAAGGKKVYDDVSIRFQYDRIFDTDIVCVGHSSETAKSVGLNTSIQYLEDPDEFTKVALVTKEDGTLIGGQVIAPRMGARIGYQIHERVEKGAKLTKAPLLDPLHKRMRDLLESTLGPIQ